MLIILLRVLIITYIVVELYQLFKYAYAMKGKCKFLSKNILMMRLFFNLRGFY